MHNASFSSYQSICLSKVNAKKNQWKKILKLIDMKISKHINNNYDLSKNIWDIKITMCYKYIIVQSTIAFEAHLLWQLEYFSHTNFKCGSIK